MTFQGPYHADVRPVNSRCVTQHRGMNSRAMSSTFIIDANALKTPETKQKSSATQMIGDMRRDGWCISLQLGKVSTHPAWSVGLEWLYFEPIDDKSGVRSTDLSTLRTEQTSDIESFTFVPFVLGQRTILAGASAISLENTKTAQTLSRVQHQCHYTCGGLSSIVSYLPVEEKKRL
jgi:hypothetical protein